MLCLVDCVIYIYVCVCVVVCVMALCLSLMCLYVCVCVVVLVVHSILNGAVECLYVYGFVQYLCIMCMYIARVRV